MRPIIGISQCLDERERWREGQEYLYLDHAYARAVEHAGGLPIMLPLQRDPAALIEAVDGLLLPGGDDFQPATPYPDDVHFLPVPERQRVFDDALLQSALERRIPVLGICYGAQLIALRHGGSLHHHIPLDVSDACNHQLTESTARHAIDVAPDSRLAALLGRRRVEVNSLHHQAIAEPGSGFRVVANAADGIVEAIECEADAFTIGVQWHPEKLDGPAGENLFKALVGACSRE